MCFVERVEVEARRCASVGSITEFTIITNKNVKIAVTIWRACCLLNV